VTCLLRGKTIVCTNASAQVETRSTTRGVASPFRHDGLKKSKGESVVASTARLQQAARERANDEARRIPWQRLYEAARHGNVRYSLHVQKSRGTPCVYLATSQSRQDRVATLQFLVSYAQMKHGAPQCLGVATEPIGNDRSYDFVIHRKPLTTALLEQLKRSTIPSLPKYYGAGRGPAKDPLITRLSLQPSQPDSAIDCTE
jgi:hypothetical protein